MTRQQLPAAELELLRHHGDVDAAACLLDFAVNVRDDRPPAWLTDALTGALARLAEYPSAELDLAAREAVAARHGRHPDEVLLLNGAAEGFTLLPALARRRAAVIHPSFTEPEVALRAAGVPVDRVLLDETDGYRLRPSMVGEDADLVVLGNPTNPTSVLHPASAVAELARAGRVVAVDEAFADAVPGEVESLAGRRLPGLLVLRSLTKTFALAGLRAGYLLGEPHLLARLARQRPMWPVGTLTLEAVRACSTPAAVAEAASGAAELARHREWLIAALATLPCVRVHQPASAPFLLLRVPNGPRLRSALRRRGIAVRRGDTFPGLTSEHMRVAVRAPKRASVLVTALAEELEVLG